MEDRVYKIRCTIGDRVSYVKKISGSGYIELGKRVTTCKLWTSLVFVEKAYDKCIDYVEKCKEYRVRSIVENKKVSSWIEDGCNMVYDIIEM